jgi:release factor glutamine methyltransferase
LKRCIREWLSDATTQLRASSSTPRLDAEVLLMHVCQLNRTALITRADDFLSAQQQTQWLALLARRLRGEPVAYLTSEREFWSMPLKVTADTLIPRPETELLVERALALIPAHAHWRIADLGTGSGAIALAMAREQPHCHFIATDISAAALAIARENTRHLGISNVEFRQGPWAAPLKNETVDMIVSNPPYIRKDDPHLDQGDVRYEPRHALIAGDDGLQAIRAIAQLATQHLKPAGWLLLEHGYDQAGDVAIILQANGFSHCTCHKDLAECDRVSVGRLPDHSTARNKF